MKNKIQPLQTKLLPPETRNTIPRYHLERLVDRAEQRRIVLINAPAGSGKSTFVIDYLNRNSIQRIWYNLDSKDSDPANFFSFFSEAIRRIADRDIYFPPFSVEYIPTIEVFSRRFFLKSLNALPLNSAIVLDNYQNLPEDSIIHRVVQVLMEEIKQKHRLFILSRKPMPVCITDWNLEKNILRLDWSHLRLTQQEVEALIDIKGRRGLTEEQIQEIINITGGWIAGVILYLRADGVDKAERKDTSLRGFSRENISLSSEELYLLSLAAELPEIFPEILQPLVPQYKDVMDLLERLSQEGFFVVRLDRSEKAYRLHDLFREYLQSEASRVLKAGDYTAHLHKVAVTLKDAGYQKEAIEVFQKINAFEEILQILKDNALVWLHTGRVYTLQKCLGLLDRTEYATDPWVMYLKGSVLRFHQPREALVLFKEALLRFEATSDLMGKKAVIGEMLDTAQYYGEDFSITGYLLEEAEKIIDSPVAEPPTVVDAMLPAYAGVMYLLHRGNSKRAVECFEIASRFMEEIGGMELFLSYMKLYAAIACDAAGECIRAEECFNEALRIYSRCPEDPPHRFMFNFLASIHEVFSGRFAESVDRIRETINYARAWGLHLHEEHLYIRLLEGLLCQALIAEAREILKEVERLQFRNSFSRAMTLQVEAQLCLIEGDPYGAAQAAERSVQLFEKIKGYVFAEPSRSLLAVALAEMGQYQRAKEILDSILQWAARTGNIMQLFTSLIHMAWTLYREGKTEELKKCLQQALSLGRERGFRAIYNWYPSMMTVLLSIALEHKIEEQYVRSLIEFHRLTPGDLVLSDEGWTWKVKIYSFGELDVVVGDRWLKRADWKGSKALNLLKALLVLDVTDVPVELITDYLWPDTEGDRARQNFEFTLRRLRGILRVPGSSEPLILLKADALSINTDLCWIDIVAFRRYLRLAEEAEKEGAIEEAVAYKEKMLHLYRGKFLYKQPESWIVSPQAQWHQRFLRIAHELTSYYRRSAQWEKIVLVCRKVLELDPLSEPFCLYLMEALHRLGSRNEAIKVFREFEALLRSTLNTQPSEKLREYFLSL